jgi:LysM repeat protein
MDLQERQALAHDFTYLRNADQVRRFVANGFLVPVRGNADYEIHGVSFPYARPEVKLFVERLSSQYRSACGEKLVVTSLTRPQNRQPANASARSVHPTGMAVDLRIPRNSACRSWLEKVLVSLEGNGVLEATRERRPPHYHIAVFPRPYQRYVSGRGGSTSTPTRMASAEAESTEAPASVTQAVMDLSDYRVRRGDSLWAIARAHGTTVDRLVSANELRGKRIYAGQVIRVPVADR